jgi:hypothetical protein
VLQERLLAQLQLDEAGGGNGPNGPNGQRGAGGRGGAPSPAAVRAAASVAEAAIEAATAEIPRRNYGVARRLAQLGAAALQVRAREDG